MDPEVCTDSHRLKSLTPSSSCMPHLWWFVASVDSPSFPIRQDVHLEACPTPHRTIASREPHCRPCIPSWFQPFLPKANLHFPNPYTWKRGSRLPHRPTNMTGRIVTHSPVHVRALGAFASRTRSRLPRPKPHPRAIASASLSHPRFSHGRTRGSPTTSLTHRKPVSA